ncbi:MAG TPA: TIGR03067 domain-containing protein [Urbifossiella sp.]|nr:TIGR03067 domain-containing protein [Urbifossiella sp.]
MLIGEKIALHRAGKLGGYMAYKADGTGYPMTIDLTPDRGPAKGKGLKGIYELDGNSLKICYVSPATEEPEKAERPKKMGAEGTVTVAFGRVTP